MAERPTPTSTSRARVLGEVGVERARQDARWGEQNHPDGTDESYRTLADYTRHLCEERFAAGIGTWQAILAEEVCEAYAETDPRRLRAELIQVAAVAVNWIEAIDRRLLGEESA